MLFWQTVVFWIETAIASHNLAYLKYIWLSAKHVTNNTPKIANVSCTHTLLLQNPVLTLHRAANMPKIPYVHIIWIIHCRAHCRKPSKFSSAYLTSAFIFSSELYIFNMFSSKFFTQISLTIKTGSLYNILLFWLKLHTKMSVWLWIEAGKLCCMKSYHWEKILSLFILHTGFFFSPSLHWEKTAVNLFFVMLVSCSIFDNA